MTIEVLIQRAVRTKKKNQKLLTLATVRAKGFSLRLKNTMRGAFRDYERSARSNYARLGGEEGGVMHGEVSVQGMA